MRKWKDNSIIQKLFLRRMRYLNVKSNFQIKIKSLTQIEEECHSVWQGVAADAFAGKMHELYEIMNKTVIQMDDLTSIMREQARKIQQENP